MSLDASVLSIALFRNSEVATEYRGGKCSVDQVVWCLRGAKNALSRAMEIS